MEIKPYKTSAGYWYFRHNGKTAYGGKTKQAALTKIRKLTRTTTSLLAAQFDEYLVECSRTLDHKTVRSKSQHISHFLNEYGHVAADEITSGTIREYQHALRSTLKRSTIKLRCIHVVAFLKWCGSEISIKLPSAPKKPYPDTVTDDELDKILEVAAARSHRDYVIVVLAAYQGLRRSEISNLQWDDISDTTVTVAHSKYGKSRTIPLHQRTQDALASHKRTSRFVVATRTGTHLNGHTIYLIVGKINETIGHEYRGAIRLTVHSLRATALTRLARSGASPYVIQRSQGTQTSTRPWSTSTS